MNNQFIDEVLSKLDGKITDSDLKIVSTQLYIIINDYDFSRKETLPAVRFEDITEVKFYLVSRKVEGLSIKSLRQYKYILSGFFRYVQKAVKDISANDIRLYLYNKQEADKLSDSSLKNIRSVICAFFSWCVNNEYITKNPCSSVSPYKCAEIEKKPFTSLEMERLRLACKDDFRTKAILEILYSTGCRVTELVNIRLDDIDVSDKSVSSIGKGKKHNTLYINARAEVAIEEYIRHRPHSSEYLICNDKNGKQLTSRWIEKILEQLGKDSGVSNVHPHRFRRTMATDALSHGMNLEKVQKMLNHKNVSTTLRYAKVNTKTVKSDHEKYVV